MQFMTVRLEQNGDMRFPDYLPVVKMQLDYRNEIPGKIGYKKRKDPSQWSDLYSLTTIVEAAQDPNVISIILDYAGWFVCIHLEWEALSDDNRITCIATIYESFDQEDAVEWIEVDSRQDIVPLVIAVFEYIHDDISSDIFKLQKTANGITKLLGGLKDAETT